jgi:hypothetical protein
MKDMYEKRLQELRSNTDGDVRRIRDDYERQIKELMEKHEIELRDLRTDLEKEKEYAVKREIETREQVVEKLKND